MGKIVFRATPVNGYDIPSLEHWLEEQAAKGLSFVMTLGAFTVFERGAPVSLRAHLEPVPNKPGRRDPELDALYEEAGWKYLGLFRGSFAVFVTEDLDAQAHTDSEIWSYALKRFFRQRSLVGLWLLVCNFLLLQFYAQSIGSYTLLSLWDHLRRSPVDMMTRYPLVPLALSIVGLALADLSWLLGLISLHRYRRAVISGKAPPRHARGGGLLVAGTLVLAVVLAETLIVITGTEYRPYPLEGSGFVVLEDIEGPGVHVSRQWPYYMDYISHDRSLLMPERWYFQEHAWAGHNAAPDSAPSLKLSAYRYPLPWLAEKMIREQSRIQWNGGRYEALSPACGLDDILVSHDVFDPERDALPVTRLILRQKNTVLMAEYRGEQDLSRSLPRFAAMMERL